MTIFPQKYLYKGLLIFSLLILLIVAAFGGYYYYVLYASNIKTDNEKGVSLYVFYNDNAGSILEKIEKSGILKSNTTLYNAAEILDFGAKIYPGHYLLKSGMGNKEILRMIATNRQTPVNLTIRQLRSPALLAGLIAQQTSIDSTTLSQTFQDVHFLEQYGFTPQNILALFLENTYQVYWTITIPQLFERFDKEWKSFWNETREEQRKKINLTRLQIITLASIVAEETSKVDEMGIVAGVYINRLQQGIKLQADPTVLFATQTHYRKRVYLSDLQYKSPYNTYMYHGLPPGPICLPSLVSIKSVLNYAKHNYLYFCARPELDGYHSFTSSYSQHLKNQSAYKKSLQYK